MRFIRGHNLLNIMYHTLIEYAAPSTLTYSWNFGILAFFCLIIQIITGIFLSMHYVATTELAFVSVEHIMRDVNHGWLLRTMHANGASLFFVFVYFHMFRGIYYQSFLKPRGLIWVTGMLIFVLMVVTAFMGYVLPWGQMSLWGATVITNLVTTLPKIGEAFVVWVWGGYSIETPTLAKFYSLHYCLPFVMLGLVGLHLVLLHERGSNNPLGVGHRIDSVSFGPYFIVKDLYSIVFFLLCFTFIVLWMPDSLGHPDNYIPANALVTPEHIVPEWYFLWFYALLRAFPAKAGGFLCVIGSVSALIGMPYITFSSKTGSNTQKLINLAFWVWLINFILLTWLGVQPVGHPYVYTAKLGLFIFFTYFKYLMVVTNIEESALTYNFCVRCIKQLTMKLDSSGSESKVKKISEIDETLKVKFGFYVLKFEKNYNFCVEVINKMYSLVNNFITKILKKK